MSFILPSFNDPDVATVDISDEIDQTFIDGFAPYRGARVTIRHRAPREILGVLSRVAEKVVSLRLYIDDLKDIDLLYIYRSVIELSLNSDSRLPSLAYARFRKLRTLSLASPDPSFDISQMGHVRRLKLVGSQRTDSLSEVGRLQLLRLEIEESTTEVLDPVGEVSSLQQIFLRQVGTRTLNFVSNLKTLKDLVAVYCAQLYDISAVKGLLGLERLDLSGCRKIVDYSPISFLRSLRTLGLNSMGDLPNLDFIQDLPALTTLDVGGSTRVGGKRGYHLSFQKNGVGEGAGPC